MRTGGYNGRRKGGCSLENRGTVRSVAKAMELLQLLSRSKKPLSLKELSAQCGYPKSTVFGLLTTMRTYDVVTQTPDGKYSLGLRLFEYGRQRAAEVGAENVFDFSLGNPSVPAPATVNGTAIRLLREQGDTIHCYTSAQGDQEARQRFADSLNRRFGTCYTAVMDY